MKQHKPIGRVVQKSKQEIMNEFVDYVASFYSPSDPECLYPLYKGSEPLDRENIIAAVAYYVGTLALVEKSFEADSFDRERVRGILESVGYHEK